MIGKIRGNVVSISPSHILVDVGGVGYKIACTPTLLFSFKEGDEADLWVHTAVGETFISLYGFENEKELRLFEHLISVSGIGPKSALGILSIAPVETLSSAIAAGDTSYLTKVSGIGKKSAEKIILELRDKLGGLPNEGTDELRKDESDALDALRALGYSHKESRDALKNVGKDIRGTQAIIREALKQLGS